LDCDQGFENFINWSEELPYKGGLKTTEMGFIITLLIIFLCIWYGLNWWNNTRIVRKKQKIDNLRSEFAARGRDTRDKAALKLQRKNINELLKLVNKLLDKHKRYITPCLFDETKSSIKSNIEKVEFDKLYALYELLLESNMDNVNDNLKNFNR
jgi:hypothetical protein